jgi:hypothetical protein
MAERTPAQIYSLVIGAVLVVAGIIGFFYSAAFDSPGKVDSVLGILDVNGWHNVVHIVTGAAGLAAFGYGAAGARLYAGGLGLVYLVVAIWGFILGNHEAILSFLPVNTEDNVLHLLIALAGFGAFAASAPRTTAGPAARGATA